MSVGNYLYHGINEIEHQTRYDQFYTGVPGNGGGRALLVGPSGARAQEGVVSIEASNPGANAAVLRLRHGGGTKSVAAELLIGLNTAGNNYAGNLQFRNVVPSSIVVTEAGALVDIVDDGLGVLHDTGIPANTRGTINYATGAIDLTWGAAPTEPITIAYDHTDYEDFASAAQTEDPGVPGGANPPTGGDPFVFTTAIGRINPGSFTISFATGPLTFADDGKGNLIETTAGNEAVVGTVNYTTGVITWTTASGALAGARTSSYTYNPFAGVVNPGGGTRLFDLFPTQLPELTAAPWAAGMSGETELALWGEVTAAAGDTHIVAKIGHFGETYVMRAVYARVSPGGESNN